MFGLFRRAPLDVVDLTSDQDFLLDLMERPWSWRQRQVEEMELGAVNTAGASRRVTVTSGFQVRLPDGMERHLRAPRARVRLPLTRRTKGPFLDLDLRGPGGTPVVLLPSSEITPYSALHLQRIAAQSVATETLLATLPMPLLEAVCRASAGGFRRLADSRGEQAALIEYLRATLALTARPADLQRWLGLLDEPAQILARRLGEERDRFNSAQNLLLALSRLRPRPRTTQDVEAWVRSYQAGIVAAERAGAGRFLATLAEYGRSGDIIVELDAPLDEAFTIKMAELRAFRLDRQGWMTERFRWTDARSVHLRAHVESHWIEIARFRVRDLDGRDVGFPVLIDEAVSEKSVAVNSIEPERPTFVDLQLKLQINPDVRASLWFVTALAWTAAIAAALLPRPPLLDNLFDMMALLAVPTTFAVSLLLAREESSLAARLQRGLRTSLLLASAALWAAVLFRVLAALLGW